MPDHRTAPDDLPILNEIRDDLSEAFVAHERAALISSPHRGQWVRKSRLFAGPSLLRRPVVLIGSGATITAAAAIALLVTPGPQPAYAVTQNANGSITVSIHDLETAAPALNARFAAMGVNDRVVPVEANCPTSDPTSGAMMPYPQATTTESITIGTNNSTPGDTEVVAAEQLPNGEVAMVMESITPPIPSCFSTTAYTLQATGNSTMNGSPIYQFTPVNTATTATTATVERR
jgi:hypothetical protein